MAVDIVPAQTGPKSCYPLQRPRECEYPRAGRSREWVDARERERERESSATCLPLRFPLGERRQRIPKRVMLCRHIYSVRSSVLRRHERCGGPLMTFIHTRERRGFLTSSTRRDSTRSHLQISRLHFLLLFFSHPRSRNFCLLSVYVSLDRCLSFSPLGIHSCCATVSRVGAQRLDI